ncbi:hypothetical protein CES86_1404 [Brucella lupini]|uniref:Uncharacterized protein n=1 Tax=Brucella lupini TaxID=255457 RepID=A0A256GVI7_9HYPH|nr:hypothetical protein CES86_1404 [Brucella lupini]
MSNIRTETHSVEVEELSDLRKNGRKLCDMDKVVPDSGTTNLVFRIKRG